MSLPSLSVMVSLPCIDMVGRGPGQRLEQRLLLGHQSGAQAFKVEPISLMAIVEPSTFGGGEIDVAGPLPPALPPR